MSREPADTETPDPELAGLLTSARAESDSTAPDLDALFAQVNASIHRAERRPSFWWQTRPTWLRRGLASVPALLILTTAATLKLRPDFADYPPAQMTVALGTLLCLLGAAIYQALRPLYQPALSTGGKASIALSTLTASLLLALFPPPGEPSLPLAVELPHAIPCFLIGLGTGLPVYVLLRLLDRGSGHPLLPACASALLGTLFLHLACPSRSAAHLLLGHFGVVLLLIPGLGVLPQALRRGSNQRR